MIRLLLDAHLSWRSADVLRAHFDDCLHVDSTGLPVPAKDSEIWRYAESNDMIIVTNDEDFMEIAKIFRYKLYGKKMVKIRLTSRGAAVRVRQRPPKGKRL